MFGIDYWTISVTAIIAVVAYQAFKKNNAPEATLQRLSIKSSMTSGPSLLKRSTHSTRAAFYSRYPINTRKIRVLIIRSGNGDEQLSCYMECLELDTPHEPFAALSHVWGPKPQGKFMALDSQNWPITDNLNAALKALRKPNVELCVWVDQFCINQEDEEECTRAFKLMNLIYREAAQVNVWFGNATESSRIAIQYFSTPEMEQATEQELVSSYDPNIYNNEKNPWLCLGHGLLMREWWRRVWVIQEVMLAKNPVVFCGTDTIQFHHLLRLLSIAGSNNLSIVRPDTTTDSMVADATTGYRFPVQAMQTFHTRLTNGETVDYIEWIAAFHSQDSKLSHDAVHGLFGLADQTRYAAMEEEYKKLPVDVVYIRATECILNAVGNNNKLDFISLGRGEHRLSGLPSWVPDFRLRPDIGCNHFPLNCNPKPPFNATPSYYLRSVSFQDIDVSGARSQPEMVRCLKLQCITVDWVAKFSQVNNVEKDMSRGNFDPLYENEFVDEATKIAKEAAIKQDQPSDALSRTLMCDMRASGSRLRPDTGFFQLPREIDMPDEFMPEANGLARAKAWSILLRKEKYHWTNGRRFMVSNQGRIGICPADTKVDDMICILMGGSMPYILRRAYTVSIPGATLMPVYRLIGACYVHGIMDGEIARNQFYFPVTVLIV